jgi:hypothetical protein
VFHLHALLSFEKPGNILIQDDNRAVITDFELRSVSP